MNVSNWLIFDLEHFQVKFTRHQPAPLSLSRLNRTGHLGEEVGLGDGGCDGVGENA